MADDDMSDVENPGFLLTKSMLPLDDCQRFDSTQIDAPTPPEFLRTTTF
ncbi:MULTISPECIES: hypothetical protein [Mesorhizobium]|nr:MULTISPECIES: hypothetical protein [Mesorhizobium]